MDEQTKPLYLIVAAEVADRIESGQLKPLQRISSVRALAAQQGVSITTAVASLRHLEERGLIEARPKSGYFVVPDRRPAAEPQAVALPRTPQLVGTQALLRQLIDASLSPDLVRLGQGVPDAGLFPRASLQSSLLKVSRRDPALITAYALKTEGTRELRGEISRHYARFGARIDRGEILVTNGCTEALSLALAAVAKAGDVIAVESPTYFGLLQIAESQGLKVIEIPVHPAEGMSVAALGKALASTSGRQIRACVASPSFSNPTGVSMPLKRRKELLRLCTEADIALIEDDTYGDLQHEGERPVPCKAFDRDGRVILCGSFTKSLAPGSRIGFAAAGRYREAMRAAKHLSTGATAPLQQQMIADYLATGRYDRFLRRLRHTFALQVAAVAQCVQREFPEETRISRPKGAFVLWVELPEGIDTMALYEEAHRCGVDFVPGPLFSASGRYRNCLRLNCGYPFTPRIEAAIGRLGALFKRARSGAFPER
jgi:DNA-binding transcriptional MocR family regulator